MFFWLPRKSPEWHMDAWCPLQSCCKQLHHPSCSRVVLNERSCVDDENKTYILYQLKSIYMDVYLNRGKKYRACPLMPLTVLYVAMKIVHAVIQVVNYPSIVLSFQVRHCMLSCSLTRISILAAKDLYSNGWQCA